MYRPPLRRAGTIRFPSAQHDQTPSRGAGPTQHEVQKTPSREAGPQPMQSDSTPREENRTTPGLDVVGVDIPPSSQAHSSDPSPSTSSAQPPVRGAGRAESSTRKRRCCLKTLTDDTRPPQELLNNKSSEEQDLIRKNWVSIKNYSHGCRVQSVYNLRILGG